MGAKKIAVLGDIHSNLEALTAVLKDAGERDVSAYVCVGDVVGYNANPSECLERLRELKCHTVKGNHDHYCSNSEPLHDFQPVAAEVVKWTRRQLSDEQKEYLQALPLVRKQDGFTLVHSTLDVPDHWGYVFDVLEAESNFNYQSTTVCFYGHTHQPVLFEKQVRTVRNAFLKIRVELGRKYFINVGSVGQPRDGDCRAAYVIYNATTRDVEIRRVEYDIEAAQAKIRAAELPERLATRLTSGR
jgi:diadenosine tetraphosphatase ApaH/serine/threonine PP2A family protein phosphatase